MSAPQQILIAVARTPAVFPFDNFNRANETPIAAPYESGMGSSGTVDLASNLAQGTGGTCEARLVTPAFTENHLARITVSLSVSGFGPAVRLQALVSDCYFIFMSANVTLQIWKSASDGGAFTQLGADITIPAIVAGSTIGLSASGGASTTLEAFVNGVSVGTRTDASSPIRNGQPGFLLNGANTIDGFFATDL